MSLVVGSPIAGLATSLSDVPDPVFSQAMVGPGVAVQPHAGRVTTVAPIGGTIATFHPHAFAISSASGTAILVHLGIDTVKLAGAGFTAHVGKGDVVEPGAEIVTWDPSEVEAAGYSSMCPVVALEISADALADLRDDGDVGFGDSLFIVD